MPEVASSCALAWSKAAPIPPPIAAVPTPAFAADMIPSRTAPARLARVTPVAAPVMRLWASPGSVLASRQSTSDTATMPMHFG